MIKTMRKSRDLTQADLAKSIGQTPSSITMYETGKRVPDLETMEALADVFNVPMTAFFAGSESSRDVYNANLYPQQTTKEYRIISSGVSKMPEEDQKRLLDIIRLTFNEYKNYFEGDEIDDA